MVAYQIVNLEMTVQFRSVLAIRKSFPKKGKHTFFCFRHFCFSLPSGWRRLSPETNSALFGRALYLQSSARSRGRGRRKSFQPSARNSSRAIPVLPLPRRMSSQNMSNPSAHDLNKAMPTHNTNLGCHILQVCLFLLILRSRLSGIAVPPRKGMLKRKRHWIKLMRKHKNFSCRLLTMRQNFEWIFLASERSREMSLGNLILANGIILARVFRKITRRRQNGLVSQPSKGLPERNSDSA